MLSTKAVFTKAAIEIVTRRDPKNLNNKMSLKQVQALTPAFNWNHYLAAMGASPSGPFLVTAPKFFAGVNTLIESESLENWKAYLRYSVLRSSSSSLSQPFVE